MKVDYDVKDISLADRGLDKIEWTEKYLASWEMGI